MRIQVILLPALRLRLNFGLRIHITSPLSCILNSTQEPRHKTDDGITGRMFEVEDAWKSGVLHHCHPHAPMHPLLKIKVSQGSEDFYHQVDKCPPYWLRHSCLEIEATGSGVRIIEESSGISAQLDFQTSSPSLLLLERKHIRSLLKTRLL